MAVNNTVNRNNLKQAPIPVIPRTMKIVNADGTVSRSGQLLLEQLQAPSVTEGTHAQRPDPLGVADGALYVESDRGVVYYNDAGVWKYLAGTMYGTLSPDQRPTDLGKNDAGFLFRATDYGREFVWNGTAWIEATRVRWGTHAERLALVLTKVIDGELFVEGDRGNVMYQNQGGAWRYIGGTMYGTVSPTDQRPTDLGSQDTRFDFRTTTAPAHEFVWSGSAWIEVGTDYSANGTLIGTRPALNLIAGSNVTISGSDNAGSDRVDVTVSSSGGGTGGAVTSVFGRTGAVNAVAGDYTVSQVTGAVPNTRNVIAGAGMSGGGPLSADVTLTALVQSVFGRTGTVAATTGDYTAAQVTGAVSGSAGLTHTNVVTKVGSTGQIVEGGITDNSAGNSNSVTISAAGKVGIGASSPLYQLDVRTPGSTANQVHVASTNTDAGGYLMSGGDTQVILLAGVAYNGTNWIAKGTTASLISQQAGVITCSTDSGLTVGASYTPTERMRITTTGSVGIGTAGPGAKLHVVGTLAVGTNVNASLTTGDIGACRDSASTTGAIYFGTGSHYIYYDGVTFQFSPATSNLPSDERLKQNVRTLVGGLDVINRIRPIEAEWNGAGDTPKGKRIVSVLAQELQKVLPGAVGTYRTPTGEEFLNYNPDEILLQLVLAVQQLAAQVSRSRSI